MSLTKINNISESKITDRVAKLINLDEEVSAIFRGVFTKANDSWSMLMGFIIVNDDSRKSAIEACHYQYSEYQFICQPITGLDLAKLISNVGKNANTLIPGLPELGKRESHLNWTESLIPSHAHQEEFPVRQFSARVCSDAHCHDTKLVAHGMPFHPSAFDLTKTFLGLDKFHGSSDARKGELCICIPDRRGHLVLSEGDIRFHGDMHVELSVVGAIDGTQVNLANPKDQFDFDSKKALDMELWLVGKDNEIIDYCSSTEWEFRFGIQSDGTDLEKLFSIISNGESEHCEFKAYINLVNTDTKAVELEKTVCALSNHQGGKVFIGVDDETNIIGINEQCQKSYKCHLNEAIKYYRQDIEKRLRESLLKNQCFSCLSIEHNKLFVLVIDVHKANGLNYLLATKEAYIRRGASSPKMTPTEIQAFPRERDVFGRELLATDASSEWAAY
ncbi:AlbA family DNA-binding domain-containing protein [Gynuella sp.]|uniref:AlbA family DNA-binding domain-containing protein n=1 Tax=Gynuella sp. TaxID=2969146 RepID=UPI003D0DE831